MFRKPAFHLILVALVVTSLAAAWVSARYYADLPNRLSQHETIILGQNQFVPGSQTALRVVVRNSKDGSPLPGADVQVELAPQEGGKAVSLQAIKTGRDGAAEISFRVPADASPNSRLVVRTRSELGQDTVERQVKVEREYRVLLTTDKPIYQPGQIIHLRALALAAFDMQPAAGQPLAITIADGKGNKVFRKSLTTGDFGVAATDFQLASEVNTGAYKITAVLGNTSSEKTVTVEHYVLPKFKIDLDTSRTYYQPGQHVSGTLQAQYFFGKPVDGGLVSLEGFTFDVERRTVFTLEGQTDSEGNYAFEFDLPAYLTGSDLEGGMARFYVEARVTDQAQHSEAARLSLPVAGSALQIQAVPEGGVFRAGVENILTILTSYPDGSPAQARLTVQFPNEGQTLNATSGEYGLAELRYTPASPYQYLYIQAVDNQGNAATRQIYFEGSWSEESLLLRPERPVYRVGETMKLTLLGSQPNGTVYLDIVREGQTISTRAVELSGGKGELFIDLSPDLYGTLELHAYKVLPSASIIRDTRLVIVSQAEELSVQVTPGQAIYRPGDTAQLSLQVNDPNGAGIPAAVGLAIVDESVFALAEADPGFAKLYFLLEQEILTPRYDLHGYGVPDLVRGLPENDPALQGAVNTAAQASLSEATRATNSMGSSPFSLSANSHEDAVQRANQRRSSFFTTLGKVSFWAFLILPLILIGLNALALRRERVLGRSLLMWWGVLATFLLAILLLPLPTGYEYYGTDLVSRLSGWLSWFESSGDAIVIAMLLACAAGYLLLIGLAIHSRDSLLGWTAGLLPVFLVVLGFLIFSSSFGGFSGDDWMALAIILGFVLVPFTLVLRLCGALLRRRALLALALLPVCLFLLFGTVPVLSLGMNNLNARTGMVVEEAAFEMDGARNLAGAAAPQAAMAVEAVKVEEKAADMAATASGAASQAGEPPRLRQYFPETMLWLPDAVTGPDGRLELEVPVADSITTWRMTALASAQNGRLGSASAPLVVFQDFFIDLDLPLSLTVGDEISIPVGVFNYLTEEQTVRLELAPADWFELQGEPVQELTIAANEISVAYFRVRAVRFGLRPFQVTAWGSKMSDAIRKDVRVFPDGKEIRFTQSDRLETGTPVRQTVFIPAEAIPGTQQLTVKIYPGVLSQVVEGLDSILRMPYGCFEQTSSTTYPNVLVLDYLKTTGQAAPEAQMKAEEYINLGYQRLTTFEVDSGGFSLFGDAPADRMLTAYGLQEFSDMARVHNVDPALLERAANWLFSQQAADGSWENDQGLVHENTWSSLGNDRLPVTAYITWSLIEAGFIEDSHTQAGIRYVRDHQAEAKDPYVAALAANALVSADLRGREAALSGSTAALLDRLAGMAQRDGQGAYWQSSVATFMGSEGQTGSIETTALASLALLRAERHLEVGNAALVYLVRQKDSFGTWHSTQATVLTLKAMLQSVRGSGEQTDASVKITLNGGQTRTLAVNQENFDVVQMVSFDDINPGRDNTVEILAEGKGTLMYQVAGSYTLPWDKLALYPDLAPAGDPVEINLSYDRTELAVNDTVTVSVSVRLTEGGAKADSALIDLGIPPGFSVQTEDLTALVERYNDTPPDYSFPSIERFELTGRQVLIYVSNLRSDQPLAFQYRMQARFPLSVQSPATSAYDYYNPDISGELPPTRLVVQP